MKKNNKFDYFLLLIVFLLVSIGVMMVFSASTCYGSLYKNDPYFLLKQQLIWAGIGLSLLWLSSKLNYQKYQKLFKGLPFFIIILLISVFAPGIGREIRGVHRWIDLGLVQIQPSEIVKIILIIYLASSLVRKKERIKSFINGFLPYFIIVGIIFVLIAIEPDLGTAIIVGGIALALLYAGGIRVFHLFYGIILALVPICFFVLSTDYRKNRITGFLFPEKDPQGISFQPLHLKISLGSGGFWGLGPGQGKEKLFYLPTPYTDSIFAVIGEELGFIGTTLIITLFSLLAWRCFKIVKKAPDEFGKLLALGLTFLICFQAIVSMGVNTVLLPTTGTTLPFLSYGGSSLLISLISVGILLNISKKSDNKIRKTKEK
ncbi:MAG: putative lipid II flippase FtsW [Candidatus Aerophobetes bacterium]|nr:putative lipid II flippase FtsW [Candidatus Aerophobetes bacterium]